MLSFQDFDTLKTQDYPTEHTIPAIVWERPSMLSRVVDQMCTTGVVVAFATLIVATLTTMGR
jgi:hypothetical protein